jgi:hypothetical protein
VSESRTLTLHFERKKKLFNNIGSVMDVLLDPSLKLMMCDTATLRCDDGGENSAVGFVEKQFLSFKRYRERALFKQCFK